MPKKVRKIAEAFDLRQKNSWHQEAAGVLFAQPEHDRIIRRRRSGRGLVRGGAAVGSLLEAVYVCLAVRLYFLVVVGRSP
jgi:hypothetical protein